MHLWRPMLPLMELWAYRLAVVLWMSLLTYLSGQPGSKVHVPPPLDKLVHLCAFGILGFFVALGVGPKRRWHAAWIAPLVVGLCGAADEWHQSFSIGRSMSLGDWLCDLGGGVAAGFAWLLAWSQGFRAGGRQTGK